MGVDLAPEALALAGENFRRLGVEQRLELRRGSWFEPIGEEEQFEAILSNPPYITTAEMEELPPEVRAEPKLALWGGPQGLDCYGSIVPKAWPHLPLGGWLLTEIGWRQGQAVAELFQSAGFQEIQILPDAGGRDRVVLGRKGISAHKKKKESKSEKNGRGANKRGSSGQSRLKADKRTQLCGCEAQKIPDFRSSPHPAGGGLVAFPTETVYGLGANGLDGEACARIFAAKGRPSDNPLILHVASLEEAKALAREWPKRRSGQLISCGPALNLDCAGGGSCAAAGNRRPGHGSHPLSQRCGGPGTD